MSQPAPPGEPSTSFPFQLYPGYPTYLPPAPPKPMPRGLKITIITLIALVILAPIGLIAGVVYGIPAYRNWYQNELIRRVHAQQPLFEDDLSVASGNWPVEDTTEDGRSYFYANSAYHMKGQRDDRTIWATGTRLFDDAAVEATVAQKGSSTGYDGVGLLLRHTDDRQDFVVFVVRQNGEWYLSRTAEVAG